MQRLPYTSTEKKARKLMCYTVNMVLNVHKTIRFIRGREKGKRRGVWRWGKREIIYLARDCHHQNDFCIKIGSDGSHFNVSLSVRDKVTNTMSMIHNF